MSSQKTKKNIESHSQWQENNFIYSDWFIRQSIEGALEWNSLVYHIKQLCRICGKVQSLHLRSLAINSIINANKCDYII